MKISFSTRSFFVFLALAIGMLAILVLSMDQARLGLNRLVVVTALFALAAAALAVLVAALTIRGLNNLAREVQRVSAVNLRPIDFPNDSLCPEEIRTLVLNFNKLVQEIARDRTAHDTVIQSERMTTLGELVAGTSHELNNPLAIVTGYADLLLEEDKLTPDQRFKLESIRNNAMRASNVVHGLLVFAQKRTPERKRADVNAIVETAIQLKDYDLRTSGIEIVRRLAPDLPEVFADAHQIEQALLNILSNAQEAVLTASNSFRIAIQTKRSGSSILMIVEDSGAGISQADLKKVFDPFFTTKTVGRGAGLGLSISYGIIREHGGEIRIQSEVGRGTSVCIELPIDDSLVVSAPLTSDKKSGASSRKFLIVDDEPEIVLIFQSLLSRDGNVIDSAANLDEALSLAMKTEYDLIFSDMKMPGGSGIDLYKRLCGIRPSYRHRMVFLSGDTSNRSTIEFFEDEGLPYFAKPFDLQTVEEFLKKGLT